MSVYLDEPKDWRFIVTNGSSATITMLDTIANSRNLDYVLNAPAQFDCRVPSDDPRVNTLYTDGEPYVEEGTRLCYGFRREGTPTSWVVRFGGIFEQLEDATRTEDGQTHLVAYDPWRYLFSRFTNNIQFGGTDYVPGLIGADGYAYIDAKASTIIRQQLNIESGNYFDSFTPDWSTYGLEMGTFETTMADISYTIQQGTSLGTLLTDLAATGVCDIIIDPIYDPVSKPGVVGTINVYAKAGSYKPTAVFSWDKPGRSLTGVSKLKDGTKRANKIRYYGAQGGSPTPPATNTTSQATYGLYEDQQFFPQVIQPYMYPLIQAVAADEIALRKDGAISVTVDPASGRAPRPFQDYSLGDWTPMLWSDNLREESILVQRIVGIPITLTDDGVETIENLIVIVSDQDQPEGFEGGSYVPGGAGVDPAIEAAGMAANARAVRRGTTAMFVRPFRAGS